MAATASLIRRRCMFVNGADPACSYEHASAETAYSSMRRDAVRSIRAASWREPDFCCFIVDSPLPQFSPCSIGQCNSKLQPPVTYTYTKHLPPPGIPSYVTLRTTTSFVLSFALPSLTHCQCRRSSVHTYILLLYFHQSFIPPLFLSIPITQKYIMG